MWSKGKCQKALEMGVGRETCCGEGLVTVPMMRLDYPGSGDTESAVK